MSLLAFGRMAFSVAGANLASALMIACLNFVLAALLTQAQFGNFSVLFVFLNFGVLICRFGMQTVIMRFGTRMVHEQDYAGYRALSRFTLAVVAICATVSGALFLFYLWWSGRADIVTAAVFSVSLFLYAMAGWSQGRVESLGRLVQAVLVARVLPFTLVVLVVIGVWVAGYETKIQTVGIALGFGFATAILVASLAYRLPEHGKSDQRMGTFESRAWLSFGASIMVVSLVQTGSRFMDILLLDYFRTSEEVAVYTIAARIAEFVSFGIMACNIVVASAIAKLDDPTAESLRPIFTNAFVITVSVALATSAILVPLTYFALPLLLEGYGGSALPLTILVAGQLVSAFCGPVIFIVANLGYQKDLVIFSSLGLAANTILNLVLIPAYGVSGAAFATACGVVIVSVGLTIRLYFRVGAAPPTSAVSTVRQWRRHG